jgi:hypothetical protein
MLCDDMGRKCSVRICFIPKQLGLLVIAQRMSGNSCNVYNMFMPVGISINHPSLLLCHPDFPFIRVLAIFSSFY